jgi:branched-chain amino acid transport system substrate-binding protein
MNADRARAVVAGLIAALLCLAGGCGDEEKPVRVGVLVDCTGLFKAEQQAEFAGAELPFKERDFSVAGRPVELVRACTENSSYTRPILQTRRLIEEDRVTVVVGPVGDPEGVVMRNLAAHYPDVTFILTATGAQEATMRDTRPNVFRFVADGAQSAAGLASYAYHELGWRRAAIAFDGAPGAWEAAAGFVAEFCSLGGYVRSQGLFEGSSADRRLAARLARESDGVFVGDGFFPAAEFLRAYARSERDLPRRLVLNGWGFSVPRALVPPGVDLSGVVIGADMPRTSERPEWRRYVRSFHEAYPDLPADAPRDQLLLSYYMGMEGLAHALAVADGQTGAHGGKLRAALDRVRFDGPMGPVHLDPRHQAVVSVHLRRVMADGGRVTTLPVRVVRNVDQSYSGTFTPRTPVPGAFELSCDRGRPPVWARG